MTEFLKKINPVLIDLITGCLLYGIVGVALIIFVVPHFYEGGIGKLVLGLVIGVILMMVLAVHMSIAVEHSLMLGEDGATKHNLKMFSVRILLVLAVFGMVYFTGIGNPITLVVGMLSLKVAAYLQPFTHKFIVSKIIK